MVEGGQRCRISLDGKKDVRSESESFFFFSLWLWGTRHGAIDKIPLSFFLLPGAPGGSPRGSSRLVSVSYRQLGISGL
jgi:hypothetical protein